MNNVLKIGKPRAAQNGKKKKDNLDTIFRAVKENVYDKNQKRDHPNRRRVTLGVVGAKPPAVKRIANNHESTRGAQMR
jgi:hypothetical protein